MSSKTPDKNEKADQSPDEQPAVSDSRTTNRMFGKYRIQKKIGSGGMGSVYLAQDTDLNRQVALKILPREKANNPILLTRFKSEAQAAATLKHDNIVIVYEAGEIDGFYYIALEYVEGIDVHRLIVRKEQIGVRRSIEIIKQIANALQHISERGVVHRDIKPSNLFIQSDGVVKLGDLGLARSIEDSEQGGVTRDGTTVGTVDYIAPEQARDSRAADIRSDLYSLGCTWYHMLTGFPPYPDGSLTNKMHAHAVKPPPNPQEKNPTVPDGVVAVLQRMMAKKPEDRYQAPKDLVKELERASLMRVEIADDVFDSLAVSAEESSDESPIPESVPAQEQVSTERPNKAFSSKKGSKQASKQTPSQAPAPPAGEWKPKNGKSANDKDDHFEFNIDPLKFIIAIILLAGILGGLLWLIWNLSITSTVSDKLEIPDERLNVLKQNENNQDAIGHGKARNEEDASDDSRLITFSDGENDKSKIRISSRFFFDLPDEDRQALRELPWIHQFEPHLYNKLKKLTVNPQHKQSSKKDIFTELSLALNNAPDEGTSIQLTENSLHELDSIKPLPGQQIVLKGLGNMSERPSIIVRPDSETGSPFKVERSSLLLDNVNLIVIPNQAHSTVTPPLFNLTEGELGLRNASLTVINPVPVTILQSNPGDAQNSILIDKTVIRGDLITVLEDKSVTTEFVGTSSLFFSRNATPFLFAPARSALGKNSSFQLLSSTATTQDALFRIVQTNSRPYQFTTHNSVLGSLSSSGTLISTHPALASVSDTNTSGSDTFDINWQEQGSLFSGWSPHVSSDSEEMISLEDLAAWNGFWGHELKQNQFGSGNLENLLDTPFISPEELVATSWGYSKPKGSKLPGANKIFLAAPNEADVREMATKYLEQSIKAGKTVTESDVVEFDFSDQAQGGVKSEKFVNLLAEDNWESGTRFILNGSGEVQLPPINIENKSLIIEAKSTDPKNPIYFTPLRTNSASSMIKVSQGSLVLEKFHIDARKAANGKIPAHLIQVESGDLELSGCRLESSFDPEESRLDNPVQSIISWIAESDDTTSRRIIFKDTFAYGFNPLILSNVEQTRYEFTNSSLLSRSHLIHQEIQTSHTNPQSRLWWDKSSFSAGKSLIQIRNSSSITPANNSFQFGMFNLYFSPAFDEGNSSGPRLMTYVGETPDHPFVSLISKHLAQGVPFYPTMVTAAAADQLPEEPFQDDYLRLTGRTNHHYENGESSLVMLPLKESFDQKLPRSPKVDILEYDVNSRSAQLDKSIQFGANLSKLDPAKKNKKKNPSKWKRATPTGKKSKPQF